MKFKWLLSELRNQKKIVILFIFNLSLGMTGFATLDSLKTSMKETISGRSRIILGGDLSISARRELNSEENESVKKILSQNAPVTHTVELLSMVKGPTGARLARLVGVDNLYPLVGELKLEKNGAVQSQTNKIIISNQNVWVHPEVTIQMGAKPGTQIKIGDLNFNVHDVVIDDPTNTFGSLSLAPAIYMGLDQLKKTNLLSYGSTVFHDWTYLLGPNSDLNQLSKQLNQLLTDPSIRIETHLTAGDQSTRFLNYLNDYLGLVALISLFLSGLGASYLYRSFLEEKVKDFAILSVLGLTRGRLILLFLFQLWIMGFLSSLVALGASTIILPYLGKFVSLATPFDISPFVTKESFLMTLLVGFIFSPLVCLGSLLRLSEQNPSELFRESSQVETVSTKYRKRLLVLFSVALWLGATVQAHSWFTGSMFSGLFIGSLLIFAILTYTLLSGIEYLLRVLNPNWLIQLSLKTLSRQKTKHVTSFIALALSSLLIAIIPTMEKSLQAEVKSPSGHVLPSLFLFDIQDEQVEHLQSFINNNHLELSSLSPLVRARISKINDIPFTKYEPPKGFSTREEETEMRFRNRGVNLTYRESLTDAESIVAGKPFSANPNISDEIHEISLEEKYADRLKLKISDVIEFDIQGTPVKGRIVNFRKVRWTSFQPNFFIQFRPGPLNDAPKTYLATMKGLSIEKKISLQEAMATKFPNISVIDVSRVIDKVLSLTSQMSLALQFMAMLSMLTGILVLFSISQQQVRSKLSEYNMLKVLGLDQQKLISMSVLESGFLAFISSMSGILISLVVTKILANYFFDGALIYSFKLFTQLVMVTVGVCMFVTLVAVWQVLRKSPVELLKSA